ncbi:GNAT family N-acetyltransferase [Streptomyces sp. NPDC057654]|uniref:GNAT family N-acetyltransferase n=1 Tax=Streptomyces sp. NPDC057654 TaxID=3346196 RepID=UPI0036AD9D00
MHSITLQPASAELRPVIEQLAELYRHDMSEFFGYLPDAEGRFGFTPLPLFFDEPEREALVIRCDTAPVGFVLTRPMAEGPTSISGFFVVRALRRRGVGRQVALQLLRSRPGAWGIAFQEANAGAARFWRGVAAAAVGPGNWREETRLAPSTTPVNLPEDQWIFLDTSRG